MARRDDKAKQKKSLPGEAQDLFQLVIAYAKQETTEPIKGLGRFIKRGVAGALLLHGWGVTEVPTASALKEYNASNVNMLMYHRLLCRAVERGQRVFDFGRSTTEGSTFKFKKQWGAAPHPAAWQYCVLEGEVSEMRPDNPRYQRAIRLWQKLPVALTRRVGPFIVRGIP